MTYKIVLKHLENKKGPKAYAHVTFQDFITIFNILIFEDKKGNLSIRMPKRKIKQSNGKTIYKDFCHCINNDFRLKLTEDILDLYESGGQVLDITTSQDDVPDIKIKVSKVRQVDGYIKPLKAIIQLTFNDCYVLNYVTLSEIKGNYIVRYPYSEKRQNDGSKDIHYPICKIAKEDIWKLNKQIVKEYKNQ